jgi:hypothetical protein
MEHLGIILKKQNIFPTIVFFATVGINKKQCAKNA